MAPVSSGVFVDASTAITSGELKLYSVGFPHIWTDRLPVNDTYTKKKSECNKLSNIFNNLVQLIKVLNIHTVQPGKVSFSSKTLTVDNVIKLSAH